MQQESTICFDRNSYPYLNFPVYFFLTIILPYCWERVNNPSILSSYLIWYWARELNVSGKEFLIYLRSNDSFWTNSHRVSQWCLIFEVTLPLQASITWYSFLLQKMTHFNQFTRQRICITQRVLADSQSYKLPGNIAFSVLLSLSVWMRIVTL
jgi:hypothetical protein